MSFLTELPEEFYPEDAFRLFSAASQFDFANARSMMWLSQLAYEADRSKINRVGKKWALTSLASVPGAIFAPLDLPNTETIVAARKDTVIVAFAGTDPLRLTNWITNFTVDFSATGAHRGFDSAVDVIQQNLDAQIGVALQAHPQAKLFFTGHSLGGALAVLAAARAAENRSVEAVYTFGMPRTGGAVFRESYRTYRLHFCKDIVPFVPTTGQKFHHVGQYLHCRSGRFADVAIGTMREADQPDISGDPAGQLRKLLAPESGLAFPFGARLRVLFRPMLDAPALLRPDLVGLALEALPPPIRDHVPHRYLHALG
jgi:triacylglycerol lipase